MASWVDEDMEPLVDMVVRAKTENLAYQNQPDIIETAADFMLISSFSAGSYSETRRDIKDLKEARLARRRPAHQLGAVGADDARHARHLGRLDERHVAPAFEVTEMAWQPFPGTSYQDAWLGTSLEAPVGQVSASEPWQRAF